MLISSVLSEESIGMRQLQVENELRDVVSRIIVQVELATSQGRTDINLALEDAFIPILRSVYNLPRLINLNRKQKNYPGIDLGDDHDRVAFQITTTTSLDKVKFTIKQFVDRSYFNSFDELYILMLSPKQASYSQASVNSLLTDEFPFDCKRHIIDLRDLLGQVSGLRLAAQERVLAEFKHILGEVDAYTDAGNWPTPETAALWARFRTEALGVGIQKWSVEHYSRLLEAPTGPPAGLYRIVTDEGDGRTWLATPDYHGSQRLRNLLWIPSRAFFQADCPAIRGWWKPCARPRKSPLAEGRRVGETVMVIYSRIGGQQCARCGYRGRLLSATTNVLDRETRHGR
ncbi:hypothetical protein AJ87_20075 [Rhizobium yanglingense]|nr:hypothetical protein AJ87_20075 [Rhizobium yanglingense]